MPSRARKVRRCDCTRCRQLRERLSRVMEQREMDEACEEATLPEDWPPSDRGWTDYDRHRNTAAGRSLYS